MKRRLPAALETAFTAAISEWRSLDGTRRLFARDASLWTGGGEAGWLGWLDAPARELGRLDLWREIAREAAGFEHLLVLGMGGSSLAPEVQAQIVGRRRGAPAIEVLDSIHPAAIARVESRIDLARTLVVVASKSGSTLEPNLLSAHFAARLEAELGAERAAASQWAVTDPGSLLESRARAAGFARTIAGEPTIGGRFSALSPFGLLPAAAQGIDCERWLLAAEQMAAACRGDEPAGNPGVALGLALAAAALEGRDKLTLVPHPRLAPLGVWLEQLVAESTGKDGRGLIPIDGERPGAADAYGADRLFVALRLAGELADGDAERLEELADAGQPVLELDVAEPAALAAEFYRWEVATAVAGARLRVDPFLQPDVEAAKIAARRLTAEVEAGGELPAEEPFFAAAGCALFAAPGTGRALRAAAGPAPGLEQLLRAHLGRAAPGDYFALLAYCDPSPAAKAAADRLRHRVRSATGVATTVGFGPRYLHSTGQAHKGGPASGLFLVVTDEGTADLPVPGQRIRFGQAIAAQARGDCEVLAERGRRVLRVHLREPGDSPLEPLAEAVERALER